MWRGAAVLHRDADDAQSAAIRDLQFVAHRAHQQPVGRSAAIALGQILAPSSETLKSYEGLDDFEHQVIDHAVQYVDGKTHTNGLERAA